MFLIRYVNLQKAKFENSSLSLDFDIPQYGYIVTYIDNNNNKEEYFFIEREEAYQCYDHYFNYLNSEV